MDTKAKPNYRSLAVRIASALDGSAPSSNEVARLIQDVELCLDSTVEVLSAERLRLVNPVNSDYEKTQKMVETLGVVQARLEAAYPRLQELLETVEHRELRQALLPRYNEVVEQRNQCSETLFTLYRDFVEQFVPLLEQVITLNRDIRQINAKTHGTELAMIPCLAEYIIEKLVLPSEQGGQNYWPDPREANVVAVQWATAIGQAHSSPLRQAATSGDWWAARAMQDDAKIAEWNRRNALQEEQRLKARQEFERSKQQAPRGE